MVSILERIECCKSILSGLKGNQPIDSKNLYDLELHLSIVCDALNNTLDKKDWMNSGKTDIGTRMSHIVHDVVDASCIQGIIMNDVISVFSEYGYKIIKDAE